MKQRSRHIIVRHIYTVHLKSGFCSVTHLCRPALPRSLWGIMLWKQDGRREGDAAEFTCRPGSVFAEGRSSRSVLCMRDGTWHTQISVCEGKLSINAISMLSHIDWKCYVTTTQHNSYTKQQSQQVYTNPRTHQCIRMISNSMLIIALTD